MSQDLTLQAPNLAVSRIQIMGGGADSPFDGMEAPHM